MKTLLITLTSLFASAAMACPNLAGSYSCENEEGGQETVTVAQQTLGGVTTYTIDGETYVADGVARQYSEDMGDGLMANGTVTMSCAGAAVNMTEAAVFTMQGQVMGNVNVTATAQKSGSNLATTVVGTAEFNGQKENINESEFCQAL